MKKSVLVIPPNDPEAILIYQLAKHIGLQVIRSHQPHGATLDREPDLVNLVRDGGWKRVVIVETPGEKTEAALRKLGAEVVIVDHHHYTGLNRAHNAKGRPLPSSLEQFLKLFRITDARLKAFGYAPKVVRGVGVMDRGFIWALQKEGYKPKDVDAVLAFQRGLLQSEGLLKDEERKDAIARRAWEKRKEWNGYQIVVGTTKEGIRERVSFIVAREVKRPTSIIFDERKRGLIYVQESPRAMDLFRKFGGFTFGLDHNWGYRNQPGNPKVTVRMVQEAIAAKD
ncbi:hypothetical protein EBS80_00860 [bacterium]|nr:hypothetical protein [bacterium]